MTVDRTRLLSNASTVTLFTVLAQFVAFVRTAIMAYLFGASAVVDAYNLALVAPVLLAGVVGGWLQAGFVGRYVALSGAPELEGARAFRSAIGRLVFAIAILVAFTAFAARQPLAAMLVPATSEGTRQLTETAIAVAAWSLVPTVLADFLGLVLNCHRRFVAAAAAPVVNASVSALTLWLWPRGDMEALLVTLMLGWFAQLILLVIACRRAGIGFVGRIAGVAGDVKSTVRLALPVLPAVLFSNGTAVVMQMACSHLGEGAVALYGYASRLHGALMQVMIIGIGTVLLPHLAGMIAGRQQDEIVRLFWRIGRASLLAYVFVLAGVLLLGEPAVLVTLGRGRFDHALAASVGSAWAILTLSLFPFAMATFLAKLFQAMQRPVLLSVSSLISLVATLLSCYVAYRFGRIEGVLAAPLVAQICVFAFFLVCFRSEFGAGALFPNCIGAVGLCVAIIVPSVVGDVLLTQHWSEGSLPQLALRVVGFAGLFALAAKLSGAPSWIFREAAK